MHSPEDQYNYQTPPYPWCKGRYYKTEAIRLSLHQYLVDRKAKLARVALWLVQVAINCQVVRVKVKMKPRFWSSQNKGQAAKLIRWGHTIRGVGLNGLAFTASVQGKVGRPIIEARSEAHHADLTRPAHVRQANFGRVVNGPTITKVVVLFLVPQPLAISQLSLKPSPALTV